MRLLDIALDNTGELVVLACDGASVALYDASLTALGVESGRAADQLYGLGAMLSGERVLLPQSHPAGLELLLEVYRNSSGSSNGSTLVVTHSSAAPSSTTTTRSRSSATAGSRNTIPWTQTGAVATSAGSRSDAAPQIVTGVYHIGAGSVPLAVVLVQTQSVIAFGGGFVPPDFNDITIQGGTLTLDLSDTEFEDGDTLTLFTFSNLTGTFDDILIESTLTGCESVEIDSTSTEDGAYTVTLFRSNTCSSALGLSASLLLAFLL